MKSYDHHMLMQEYLPIALRGTLPDHMISFCNCNHRYLLTLKSYVHNRAHPEGSIDEGYLAQENVACMEEQGDQKVTEEIKWLTCGPLRVVKKYSGYLVKGYRFHTRKRQGLLRTQNSGVDVMWVDINKGCKKDDNVTLVSFSYKTHTGVNLIDDLFVFGSQVDMVFYFMDPKHIAWVIVRHVKLRDLFDVGGAYDDIFDLPNLKRLGDDGIDVSPEMIIATENTDVIDDEENNRGWVGVRGYASPQLISILIVRYMIKVLSFLQLISLLKEINQVIHKLLKEASLLLKNTALLKEFNQQLPFRAQKKVRGYTQKTETWHMSSYQKIIMTFNRVRKPVEYEGNELVQYLGTRVRMANHAKFVIHPAEISEINKWHREKGRTWKGSLKACAYDSSLTIDQIVAPKTEKDNRVNPTQFKKLVTHWFTLEYQSMCDLKRKSRAKMEEPHVSRTKSFARLAHEENGVYLTRVQIYAETRTHKNGNIVNEKVAQVMTSLQAIARDSSNTQGSSTLGSVDDFPNDNYSKLKGPEKRGVEQLKTMVNVMANIIQEHIPNANLSGILSNMNIPMPGITSTVLRNSNSVNQIASSKSHHNDDEIVLW
uniref:DUF4216 domain-containing protein n=1 Tax=Lactuca sativa TaxID=4236 RepID=A0A9R1V066_LACSA|nr:hypothetical protein LSAT_V11C700381610 [Lactuca sativa]